MSTSNKFNKLFLVLALSGSTLLLNGCVTALVGGTALGAGAVVGSDSRPIDVQVDDEKIEYNVIKILKSDAQRSKYENFRVDAVSVNGNVLIVGQTLDTSYLNECIEKIRHVKGIKRIFNQVEIKAPVGTGVVANDTIITSKVKSALLFGSKISSGRFKVYTEDSVVYLLGYVTKEEGQRAINQARKVNGIKKIHPIFDYMDASGTPNSTDGAPVTTANTVSSASLTQSSSSIETDNAVDNGGAVLEDDDNLLSPSAPAAPL